LKTSQRQCISNVRHDPGYGLDAITTQHGFAFAGGHKHSSELNKVWLQSISNCNNMIPNALNYKYAYIVHKTLLKAFKNIAKLYFQDFCAYSFLLQYMYLYSKKNKIILENKNKKTPHARYHT
jgi:hypothetical protein